VLKRPGAVPVKIIAGCSWGKPSWKAKHAARESTNEDAGHAEDQDPYEWLRLEHKTDWLVCGEIKIVNLLLIFANLFRSKENHSSCGNDSCT